MEKVLLIGGSGSIGKAFIKQHYDKYDFYNISRNENHQFELETEFPKVTNYISSIEDVFMLDVIFDKVKPDIVIHLAAIKHIEMAQRQPIMTCKINVIGSLNVVSMCRKYKVPITVGISTDKACASEGIYGASKYMMERCFLEANTFDTKFALCRFANVANSSSSIIPNWKKLRDEGLPLKVTDKRMNRMMFSLSDAARFIYRTIVECEEFFGGFIAVKTDMKAVNIYDLAKCISDDIEIIGKRTSVEKFDEDLISEKELPFTHIVDDGHVYLFEEVQPEEDRLKQTFGSHNAERMTMEDIKRLIGE
jgi:UDP-N-acetylglucosamine 4,6-dehydratase/5-epimerase